MDTRGVGRNIFSGRFIYFLIGAISLLYLVNNFIWLRLNVYPYGPDEFSHLLIAQNFRNAIVSGKADFLFGSFKLSAEAIWPPLFHFLSACLSFISVSQSISPLVINFVFLLILLFSVYSIGSLLYNRRVGIIAVVLVSLYPAVFRYSRFFGLDFAQMSVVCLSLYFLIRTQNFSNKRFSLLFGLSVGAGLLIKWSFILFISGPLFCVIAQAFILKKKDKAVLFLSAKNLFLSGIIGLLLSLIWYVPGHAVIWMRLKMFLRTLIHHPAAAHSINKISVVFWAEKFTGYLRLLINEQVSLLFFLIAVLALPFFLKKRHKMFIFSWYIFPYLMLSLSFYQEGRFMLPAVPAVALISAAGLEGLSSLKPNLFLKHLFFAMLFGLGLAQFFDVSFNYERQGRVFPISTPVGTVYGFCNPTTEQHGWALYGPPFRKGWGIEKIADSLADECRKEYTDNSEVLVGLMGEDEYVRQVFCFPKVLDYYLARQCPGVSFKVVSFLPAPRHTDWGFVKKLDKLKYFIFISGLKNWPEFNDLWLSLDRFKTKVGTLGKLREDLYNEKKPYDFDKITRKLNKFLNNKENRFSLIDEIRLPDGYYAYIYSRLGNIK